MKKKSKVRKPALDEFEQARQFHKNFRKNLAVEKAKSQRKKQRLLKENE